VRLTTKSEYGLLAMIHLARAEGDEPVSTREIAEAQAIPARFLEQLIATLRRSDLVVARRGSRGGFALSRPAEKISVLDIVEALEGELVPTPCDRAEGCGRSAAGCAAAVVWDRAGRALRDVLGTTTLADVSTEQARLDSVAAAHG
jgi:Rrf2 family cysteine metabolism transcriptional repressor